VGGKLSRIRGIVDARQTGRLYAMIDCDEPTAALTGRRRASGLHGIPARNQLTGGRAGVPGINWHLDVMKPLMPPPNDVAPSLFLA